MVCRYSYDQGVQCSQPQMPQITVEVDGGVRDTLKLIVILLLLILVAEILEYRRGGK